MKNHGLAYLFFLLAFLLPDGVWLTLTVQRFYAPHLGHLMGPSPHFAPAIAFYLLYAAGLTVFVVAPAVRGGTAPARVFALGALLGLVAYGTYDLTNQASLRDWPLVVTLVDLAWGALLTGTASVLSTLLTRRFT